MSIPKAISFQFIPIFLIFSFAFQTANGQNYTVLDKLLDVTAELPTPLLVWPLNWLFTNTDANANGLDATFKSTGVVLVDDGPYATANSSFQLHTTNLISYIELQNNALDFGNSSWTITTFVNADDEFGSVFEFKGTPLNAHLWHHPIKNKLLLDPVNGSSLATATCQMKTWQFVAVTFDFEQGTIKLYCNASFVLTLSLSDAPATSDTLQFGFSDSTPISKFKFACISIYGSSLTPGEIWQTKRQCEYFHKLECSPNCEDGTCTGDMTKKGGFQCTCKAKWTGEDCNTRKFTIFCLILFEFIMNFLLTWFI